jgi:hypothetical protein
MQVHISLVHSSIYAVTFMLCVFLMEIQCVCYILVGCLKFRSSMQTVFTSVSFWTVYLWHHLIVWLETLPVLCAHLLVPTRFPPSEDCPGILEMFHPQAQKAWKFQGVSVPLGWPIVNILLV